MAKLARDVMTPDPACCTPDTTLDEVAKLMLASNCGEIPVLDRSSQPIGVITDRDIVCRIVAEGKNPIGHTASEAMSQPVVTVRESAPLEEVLSTMERHQIRRVLVVDTQGSCTGIIAQADIARVGQEHDVAELVREVSRDETQERTSTLLI
jgi:CBS domain-containing protein